MGGRRRNAAGQPRGAAPRQGVGAAARIEVDGERGARRSLREREPQRDIMGRNAIEEGNDILGKFNPGLGAQRFDMEGAAKFVPKGSDLVFELHYTDVRQARHRRVEARARAGEGAAADALLLPRRPDGACNLAIPAGDGNAEVVSEITFGEDARLVYAQPHMHLRGKDFELRVVDSRRARRRPCSRATGTSSGRWATSTPSRLRCPRARSCSFITHFDNSPANRFNPDPTKKVVWGPQNWDEMSNCFIGVLFDREHRAGEGVPAIGPEPAAARRHRPDARRRGSRDRRRRACFFNASGDTFERR